MARRVDESPAIASGLNSSIEFSGQTYHVQTQCSKRDAPIIESLVFQGGQTLVRITASYDDIASRLGFSGDDGRHLLELQHANLIQKIRHGLLRDNEAERASSADHEEPARPQRAQPTPPPTLSLSLPARPWWRRLAIVIRLRRRGAR